MSFGSAIRYSTVHVPNGLSVIRRDWSTYRSMGLYARYIFPRLMDRILNGEMFQELRRDLLKEVSGAVLEIGLGTGLNLPHYPKTVARLHAVEPEVFMQERLVRRIKEAPFPVDVTRVSAEVLPLADQSFDFAVSTWTLCTIPDPIKALREIRRILKPGGRCLFLEHGRSNNERVAIWQDRLNPLQNVIGCGCNLNRRIDELVEQAEFQIGHLDRFGLEGVPRIAGEMYRGWAEPSASAAF